MTTSYRDPAVGCIMPRKAGIAVDRIIIHVMEGSLKGTVAWFRTPKPPRAVLVCAHYLIGLNGNIVQMCPDDKKCYHANNYNSRSLGIEHEGWTATFVMTTEMLQASAKVTAILCRKFNIPMDREHIIGHNEVPGATHTDPGPRWPWDEYIRLVTGTSNDWTTRS